MAEGDPWEQPTQPPARITVHPSTLGPLGNSGADPWEKDQGIKQPPIPPAQSGPIADNIATSGPQSDVLNAFEQGFKEQWGAPNFAKDLQKTMEDHGVLWRPDTADKYGVPSAAKSMNEAVIRGSADILDLAIRTSSGLFQGVHDASIAAGHPWDAIAAGMEAFPLAGAELGRTG